jgi:hypothetical protein
MSEYSSEVEDAEEALFNSRYLITQDEWSKSSSCKGGSSKHFLKCHHTLTSDAELLPWCLQLEAGWGVSFQRNWGCNDDDQDHEVEKDGKRVEEVVYEAY